MLMLLLHHINKGHKIFGCLLAIHLPYCKEENTGSLHQHHWPPCLLVDHKHDPVRAITSRDNPLVNYTKLETVVPSKLPQIDQASPKKSGMNILSLKLNGCIPLRLS
jgi:hypothetical protein